MTISKLTLIGAVFLAVLWSTIPTSAARAACPASITASLNVFVSGQLSDLFFDNQCQYLYATNKTQNRIEVFSLQTRTLGTPITVGSQPTSIDASPDGQTLYVANSGENDISLVSVAQRVELRKRNIPFGPLHETPYSIAVAQNGTVLIGTTFTGTAAPGSGYDGYGNYVLQYNPATGPLTDTVVPRLTGPTGGTTVVKASGDRSVIGIAVGDNSFGTVDRYISASDTVGANNALEAYISSIALDQTGAVSLVNSGGYVLNASLNLSGRISSAGGAVAVDPSGATGYAVGNDAIDVLNLASFLKISTLTAPGADSAITISPDGTLLAVATSNGFEVIVAPQSVAPSLHIITYSTAQTQDQSFLRFYNAGNAAGTVNVTLADLNTGQKFSTWTSPSIPSGAAPQYSISVAEAAAAHPFVKPTYYMTTIQASFPGTFAHVLWRPGGGMLTNLSTCNSIIPAAPTRLVNVHSSLLDYGFPSSVNIVNTGAQAAAPTLGLYDAATGSKLGAATLAQIAAGGAQIISVDAIERAANFTPASVTDHYLNHYVVKLEGAFAGYLQHLLQNLQPGITTDMTTVCPLPH